MEERPLGSADLAQHRQLTAMGAHEIRNLMGPLHYGVELLSASDGDVRNQARVLIRTHLAQLGRVVDDLCDLSISDAGRMRLQTARVDLASVVTAAIEIARPAITRRHQELSVLSQPQLPLAIE